MSIITSKQTKRQTVVDPILILFVSVLVVLLVFAFTVANRDLFTSNVNQNTDSITVGLSLNSNVSFAADERYWDANCSTGWSSDAGCDAIVARTQACSVSVDSAYCSAYENYLQQFDN